MSLQLYIYPNIDRSRMGSQNPYIEDLKQSLTDNGFRVSGKPAQKAFVDLLLKGFRSDAVILNWIEDIPTRRMGLIQTMVLVGYLAVLKWRGVKIIWIKHNRVSHGHQRMRLKQFLQSRLTRYADHIIIHAKDTGLPDNGKLLYAHHPNKLRIEDVLLPEKKESLPIDFLIWGSLAPYKGVLEFLRFAAENKEWKKYRIHVIGKCSDATYWRAMEEYGRENIVLENKFVEEEELRRLFRQSRFILFTYQKESILSSGVLIDSLAAGKRIIAPDCGAFTDMAHSYGFVSTFGEFSEIEKIYASNYDDYLLDREELAAFISQNSWDRMGQRYLSLFPVQTTLEKKLSL